MKKHAGTSNVNLKRGLVLHNMGIDARDGGKLITYVTIIEDETTVDTLRKGSGDEDNTI